MDNRKINLIRIILFGVISASVADFCFNAAYADQKITGRDWLLMNREEKVTYIFSSMEVSQNTMFL